MSLKSSLSLGTGIQCSSCQLLALHMRRHFLGFLGKQSFFCLSHEELGEMLSLDSLIWVWNCHGHFAPKGGFLGATGGHPVDGEYEAHRGEGRAERWKELGAWWHYLHRWKKKTWLKTKPSSSEFFSCESQYCCSTVQVNCLSWVVWHIHKSWHN